MGTEQGWGCSCHLLFWGQPAGLSQHFHTLLRRPKSLDLPHFHDKARKKPGNFIISMTMVMAILEQLQAWNPHKSRNLHNPGIPPDPGIPTNPGFPPVQESPQLRNLPQFRIPTNPGIPTILKSQSPGIPMIQESPQMQESPQIPSLNEGVRVGGGRAGEIIPFRWNPGNPELLGAGIPTESPFSPRQP